MDERRVVRENKKVLLARIRRLEGQARGLTRMIEDDRYCIDILQQIASLRSAANSLALILLRGHLEICFAEALQTGSQEEKLDEVIEAVRRYSRS